MRSFFDRLVKEHYPRGTKLADITIRQHGHFAFKRAVSYTLDLVTPRGKRVRQVLRGNVPSTDMTASLAIGTTVQKQLYRQGFAFGDYRVPPSLGFYRRLRLGLYENFPGTTLADLYVGRSSKARRATQLAATWLARFHATPIRVASRRSYKLLTIDGGYFIDNFRRGYPAGLGRIRRALAVVEQGLKPLLGGPATIVHGDFHPANVIQHPDGPIGVIDFGNCSLFDPLSDVGSFLAQTDRFVWDNQLTNEQATKLKRTFITTYFKTSPLNKKASQKKIDYFYCWWIIQLLAYSAVIRSPFARQRLTDRGLAAIEKTLLRYGKNIRPTDPTTTTSAMMLKKQLVDTQTMLDFFSSHLETCLPDADHIDSLSIKQPGALSLSSFLTRYTITYRDRSFAAKTAVIRGNHIPSVTHELLQRLSHERNLPIMRPILWLDKTQYLFYPEVAGNRFRELTPRGGNYKHALTAIATTLAALHHAPVAGQVWTPAAERRWLTQTLAIIRRRDPAHTAAAAKLAHRLRQTLTKNWTSRVVTTHGDLQGSNILIGPDQRAWLIDFTMAKRFHPAHDVATFINHLNIMLYYAVSEQRRRALSQLFMRQYQRRAGRRLSASVNHALTYHLGRSALDIIAITDTNLGPDDPSRDDYVEYLLRENNLPR